MNWLVFNVLVAFVQELQKVVKSGRKTNKSSRIWRRNQIIQELKDQTYVIDVQD